MAENRIRGVRWLSAGNNSGRRIPYDRSKQDQDSRAYCRRKPVQAMGGTSEFEKCRQLEHAKGEN